MDKELLKIGTEVASLWGAECISYTIDMKHKQVIFLCIEVGEKFTTTVSFQELKSEYNYKGDL